MTTALVSALTGAPVRRDVAMTGEVTLRGRVLPIGGLKEKSMAAYIRGIKTVIIPKANVPDLDEVDDAVKANVEFVPVSHVDEVLSVALCPSASPPRSLTRTMTLKTANTPISRRTIKQADAEAASRSEVFMRFDIIEFDRSYGTSAQLKRFAEPEIVFSGRSNVGKSSLMNKLFNRKNLARVSSVPGKTVTVNFFKGDKVNFVTSRATATPRRQRAKNSVGRISWRAISAPSAISRSSSSSSTRATSRARMTTTC